MEGLFEAYIQNISEGKEKIEVSDVNIEDYKDALKAIFEIGTKNFDMNQPIN